MIDSRVPVGRELLTAALPVQIRPLEELFKFGAFFSSLLTESDFEAKPSVLLLGQYSTGMPAPHCLPLAPFSRTRVSQAQFSPT